MRMASNSSFDAVTGLVQAMVTFDPLAAQHLTATSQFAERLAKLMDLDGASVENCRLAGLLHDIGLFGMDRFVLDHPGMLSDAEWDVLTKHPVLGERLLLRIPSIAHLAPIVRAHHERIDGSGYPDGLIESEIPLEARIIAVVDAFHSMSMPQRYRGAFAPAAAMAELLGNRGSHFDADVVDAFATMIGHRQRRTTELRAVRAS
jgi:HD-GYP domain-containing protein (c-di-GMP phosphodiesterase class II)